MPEGFMAMIAKKRHANMTPEAKKEHSIKMNQARWSKKILQDKVKGWHQKDLTNVEKEPIL